MGAAYWEEYYRTSATELDGKVDEQISKQQSQLAAAEESKKEILRKLIHGWEKLRYLNRYNAVTKASSKIAREKEMTPKALLEVRRARARYPPQGDGLPAEGERAEG